MTSGHGVPVPLGQPGDSRARPGQPGALRTRFLQSHWHHCHAPKGSPRAPPLSPFMWPHRSSASQKGQGCCSQSLEQHPQVLHPAENPTRLLRDPKTTALPQQPHEVKTTLPLATSASPAATIPVHKARAACAALPLLQLLFPAQQTMLHALSYQMLQNPSEERPGIPCRSLSAPCSRDMPGQGQGRGFSPEPPGAPGCRIAASCHTPVSYSRTWS